jgi:hypothetical protein
MMNPFSWLQMTNMISYQGLVRTFPKPQVILGVLGSRGRAVWVRYQVREILLRKKPSKAWNLNDFLKAI